MKEPFVAKGVVFILMVAVLLLTGCPSTPDTTDKQLVTEEAAKYETSVTIGSDITPETDVTSLVKVLKEGQTARGEVNVAVTAVGEEELLSLKDGVVGLKLQISLDAPVDTTGVTLTLSKGSETKTVNVAVTIERQPGPDGENYDEDGLSFIWNGGSRTYSVKASASTIAGEIVIPATGRFNYPVTSIETQAFERTGITAVTIPAGVTSIGNYAFYDAGSLAAVTFETGNQLRSIGSSAFKGTGVTEITIPSNITTIGDEVFAEILGLQNVTVLGQPTSIGSKLLYGAHVDLTVSAGGLVYGWSDASKVAYSVSGLTDINTAALVIPEKGFGGYPVTKIEGSVFDGASNLKDVTVQGNPSIVGSYFFKDAHADLKVSVPAEGLVYGWSDASKTAYSVTGLTDKTVARAVVIPESSFGGYPVTGIGNNAFERTGITAATIPAGVTSIGNYAFYDAGNLTAVAFEADSELQSIGSSAFARTGITEMMIPSSVTTIGDDVFSRATSLKSIAIEGTPSVGSGLLDGTHADLRVSVPAEGFVYGWSDAYKTAYSVTGLTDADAATAIVIPEKGFGGYPVRKIGASAFRATGITEITVPENVTIIGDAAFAGASSLKKVAVGGTPSVGSGLLDGTHAELRVSVPAEGFVYGWNDDSKVAYSVSGLTDVNTAVLVIPEKGFGGYQVEMIEDGAFAGALNLQSVTVRGNPTVVDSNLFKNARANLRVSVPAEGLVYGWSDSSQNAYSVTGPSDASIRKIDIPEKGFGGYPVKMIGNSAFAESAITEITVPASIIIIGTRVFDGASNLKSVTVQGTPISVGMGLFDGTHADLRVSVPDEGFIYGWSDAYKTAYSVTGLTDADAATTIVIPEKGFGGYPVKMIGNSAFAESAITEITIPTSVTGIGEFAFANTGLVLIEIPESVTSIGAYAFENTRSFITEIVIPASVTNLGKGAFKRSGVTKVTFAPGTQLQSISSELFMSSALTSIELPESVTNLGYGAFLGANSLAEITIPAGATTGFQSFTNVSNIMSVTILGIPTNAERGNLLAATHADVRINVPDEGLVYGWSDASTKTAYSVTGATDAAATDLVIPESSYGGKPVTNIGTGAFKNSSLRSIEIPANMTSIGDEAFSDSTDLASVTVLATTPPALGSGVFGAFALFHVPADSLSAYIADSTWAPYSGRIRSL